MFSAVVEDMLLARGYVMLAGVEMLSTVIKRQGAEGS
jgi:hypothetical protein